MNLLKMLLHLIPNTHTVLMLHLLCDQFVIMCVVIHIYLVSFAYVHSIHILVKIHLRQKQCPTKIRLRQKCLSPKLQEK